MKVAIISGITGQDGAYLAQLLLSKNYKVFGITRTKSLANLENLEYLKIREEIQILECDLLDLSRIINIIKEIKPTEFYNLAAQSSVGFSFSQPIGTIQFNTLSVVNILEAIRLTWPSTRFYQASSSEMYGKVENLPINTNTPMYPLSPYAISKASAHWIVVNYRESYNLFACNGVLFNHESYLRHNSFFIKKVVQESLLNRKKLNWQLKVGNIEVKRDFGYSPKYVEAMWLMLSKERPKDFIICSGKSYLLRDLVFFIFNELGISEDRILVSQDLYRPTDILDIFGEPEAAKKELGWNYDMDFYTVLKLLIEEEIKNLK